MPRVPPMITLHPLPLMPWAGISSSQLGTCVSEARIIDWSSQRRPWPTQRPCSPGWKKPSHHAQANPADQWKVCGSCTRPWKLWPPSQM